MMVQTGFGHTFTLPLYKVVKFHMHPPPSDLLANANFANLTCDLICWYPLLFAASNNFLYKCVIEELLYKNFNRGEHVIF